MKTATPKTIPERTTPTLFLNFYGTLHVGHAVVDVDGQVSLESGRPLFEYHFGREPGQLMRNFLLLDSSRGISDKGAQQRIREWLVEVHKDENM
jgi:hypothetical protein